MNAYPDFFIAGFNRTGTSTLHALLDQHPRICMSQPKEQHYFNFNINYSQGKDYYATAFSHCDPGVLKGEATPSYIYKAVMFGEDKQDYIYAPDDDSIQRMARHCPEAKIIISLRHPVKAAYSNFNKARIQGREPSDISFEEAIMQELEGERTIEQSFLCHYCLTSYVTHIRHLLSLYPRENILFLVFENWTKNQQKTLKEIANFLGCPLSEYEEPEYKEFSPIIKNKGRQSRLGRVGSNIRKFFSFKKGGLIYRHLFLKQGYQSLDPETLERIGAFYTEQTKELEGLTGLDLSLWNLPDKKAGNSREQSG